MTDRIYRYAGGLEAVTVFLPSGRALTVARGEEVRLLPVEAAALSDHPEWEAVPPPSRKAET